MQKKRRRLAMIVAIVLAALIILPLVISALSALAPKAEGAVTQKDLDNLKKNINDLKANLSTLKDNKTKLQGQIHDIASQQADIVQRKNNYDEQLENLEEEIRTITELVAGYTLAIAGYQQELEEAQKRELALQDRYIDRIRAMERMGDISYLSIILQAESLTDLLTRWDAMNAIMDHDRKLADELVETRIFITETIEQLAQDKQEQKDYKQELAETQVELSNLSREIDEMMLKYIQDIAAVMEKVLSEEERIKAEEENIKKAQKELDDQQKEYNRIQELLKKNNSKYVGGDYMWPLPGYYNVSSGFGDRIHPIYKVTKHHNGIDISPVPKGAKIVAANTGTIIIRERHSSYGNYVVLDHGGGQATLYAHMSGFANGQKVGTVVSVGDTIGYVGSTGLSTGNHLHFEIHKGGKPVNPLTPGLLIGKK